MRRAGLEAAAVYTVAQILKLAHCATQGMEQSARLELTDLLLLLSNVTSQNDCDEPAKQDVSIAATVPGLRLPHGAL